MFTVCYSCYSTKKKKRKPGNEMKVCAKNSAYLWWFCQWYFITHLPHFTWHTFIDAVSHEVNSKHKEQRIGIKELNLCDYCRLWRAKCKPKKENVQLLAEMHHTVTQHQWHFDIEHLLMCATVSRDRISQIYCGNARMQWYWFSIS